jgi:hypothetical protein
MLAFSMTASKAEKEMDVGTLLNQRYSILFYCTEWILIFS